MEELERVKISEESLLSVGFKKHKTLGIETYNFIKGDFRMNTVAFNNFFFKDRMIMVKIRFMDEFIAMYEKKTGEKIIK